MTLNNSLLGTLEKVHNKLPVPLRRTLAIVSIGLAIFLEIHLIFFSPMNTRWAELWHFASTTPGIGAKVFTLWAAVAFGGIYAIIAAYGVLGWYLWPRLKESS